MTILSNPNNSCLLIIDPKTSHCGMITTDETEYLSHKFMVLDFACSIACIPRYYAITDFDGKPKEWLSKPCEESIPKTFDFFDDSTPWSNLKLVEAIKSEKRERLFICGFWLDSTVSATALDAYVDGFDVHLISDIAPARNTIQGKSALERLLQIGVVPISTQQLLYEWMTKTPNKSDRENLHQLIENSP